MRRRSLPGAPSRSVRQLLVTAAVAMGIGLVALVVNPPADSAMRRAPGAKAWAPKSLDVRFVMAINELRREHGVAPLAVDTRLQQQADAWTMAMAKDLFLEHDAALAVDAPIDAILVGENVGRGTSVPSLMVAFEASSPHRDNLLASNWTHVGVGSTRADDGRIYTTHRFAELPITE